MADAVRRLSFRRRPVSDQELGVEEVKRRRETVG
jgi:hypothetical protein